jgi:alkylhydroperoxidase family enzyme
LPILEPADPGAVLVCSRWLLLRQIVRFDFRNSRVPVTAVSNIETYSSDEVLAMSRIEPLEAPYDPEVAEVLEAMMPPGAPPIALFRTFVHNLTMTQAMSAWGGYELSKRSSLSMRQRELVIDRVTARCRCEYEWGVHLAYFADRIGLTIEQRRSITHGSADDACWDADESALLRAVDELHDRADIADDTWRGLTTFLADGQILDVLMLAGWYHAISFTANAARVPLEPGAPRFDDVR